MKSLRFKALLQNSGWVENACVSIDADGRIISVVQNASLEAEFINGLAIPAFQNAHSHAFQYAMAGLAENHAGDDDFWSWRETMYSLALNLEPDEIKTIAKMLYAELLRHGYANVAEFHYLHHDRRGYPYDNLAEIGQKLIEAAQETGIKITLIPIFYQTGGFGSAPNERQKRFISADFDDYERLFNSTFEACKFYENANAGVGVHSLRAVKWEDVLRVVKDLPSNVPFHIHIAEQLKEVADCLGFFGKRPVEWFLENIEANERFHLVHATQMTDDETLRLAQSGANVVICPSTEGNLGDGIFPLHQFESAGGRWSIGTDSHIGLNPLEELRLLDYGQRLISHKRNTFRRDGGLAMITQATLAGRRAMNNFEKEFFAVGAPFDACLIDADAPLTAQTNLTNLASTIVYAADSAQILGTFVNGRFHAADENYDRIKTEFLKLIGKFRGAGVK